MKKALFLILVVFICSHNLSAQSFGVEYTNPDTVYFTYSGNGIMNIEDSVYVPSNSVYLKWNVIGTNFPADWVQQTAFCDADNCYMLASLWPSGSLRSPVYSAGNGAFFMAIDFSSATSCGTYYVAVRMYNDAIPADTAREVYAIGYCPTAVPNVNNTDDIILYPNPASNSVNVVYSPAANVKVIAVYSMIGKMMVVNKVGTSSANINIENLPAGVYFMRLINAGSEIIAIRKFTKE